VHSARHYLTNSKQWWFIIPPISTKGKQIIVHKKKTMTYADGSSGPVLGQAQKCFILLRFVITTPADSKVTHFTFMWSSCQLLTVDTCFFYLLCCPPWMTFCCIFASNVIMQTLPVNISQSAVKNSSPE
jgi:hypothetical protein